MTAAGSLQCPLGASELPTMSSQSQILASSSQFESIPESASREYEKNTGNDLLDHWLSEEIQSCDSVEAVLDIRQDQTETFDTFRNGDKRVMKWIGSSEQLYKISSPLGAGTARTIRDDLRWFFRGSVLVEWKCTGSPLWIHGKCASVHFFRTGAF